MPCRGFDEDIRAVVKPIEGDTERRRVGLIES